MRKHHTKNKGDLGVLKAKVALYEQGYMTLTPDTEHCPYDIAAYKDSKFLRVQVKYRAMSSTGTLYVKFASTWADKHGNHTVPWDKSEVDILCVYCPETDACYFLDPKQFGKSVSLRVKTPKNNQKQGVHLIDDYRRIP